MSEKHLVDAPDDGGDTLTSLNDNGFLIPNFPDGQGIEGVRSVRIRDDDIIICTFPKSGDNTIYNTSWTSSTTEGRLLYQGLGLRAVGTHWVWEITRELLTGEITDDDVTMSQTFMEMGSEERYADLPSPRILSSHLRMKHLPDDVLNKKIKVITVLRNPKDVAVSYYPFLKTIPFAKYKGEWKNFLRPLFQGKFMYESWMDYVLDWELVKKTNPDQPVLTLFYEDIKQDQMREMRRICEFLGVERTDDFLSKVCDNTTMAVMRTQKNKGHDSSSVFRKGGVGDWKNWFTVAQNEWFDKFYQEKMADCPLQFKYTL